MFTAFTKHAAPSGYRTIPRVLKAGNRQGWEQVLMDRCNDGPNKVMSSTSERLRWWSARLKVCKHTGTFWLADVIVMALPHGAFLLGTGHSIKSAAFASTLAWLGACPLRV